jgi:Bifunctional DNA primase/polymerase, N-terminal
MSEMEQWVGWYGEQSLVYFPLYGILNGQCRCKEGADCKNPGKHPVWKWKGVPPRMPRVTDNIGISTDNLVVVDIDGDVPESALAEYPRTFTTSTGHGFHLWYRADPTKPVKSVVGWKPKVDVRAVGGLVVAPPSRHSSGSVYRHVAGDSIQPVPRTLLDSLPEKGSSSRKVGHTVTDEMIRDATPSVFAGMVDVLVSEMLDWQEGRNVTLFRLGCRYYEQAAIGMLGADALSELVSAALSTGLSPDEIYRTLESARRSV